MVSNVIWYVICYVIDDCLSEPFVLFNQLHVYIVNSFDIINIDRVTIAVFDVTRDTIDTKL